MEIAVSLIILRGLSAAIFIVIFLNTRNRRHLVITLGFALSAISVILRGFPYPESLPVSSLAGVTSLGASALIASAVISYLRSGALRALSPVLLGTLGAAAIATAFARSGTTGALLSVLQAAVLTAPVFVYGRRSREAKRVFSAAPGVVAAVFLSSSAYAVLAAFGEVSPVVATAGPILLSTAQIAVFIFAEHSTVLNDARRIAARLQRAEEAVGVGLWERDATNGNAIWSTGHFQIFGVPPDSDAAPNWDEFLSMIHPDDRGFIENSQWTETSTGAADLIQYRIVRPDGEVRWVSSKAIAIDSHMSYGIVVDITALRSTEERLEQSLRQKDSLIAEIQHRVKNNLQIISSMFNLQFVSNHHPIHTPSEIERFRARLDTMAAQQSLILDSVNASEVEMQSYVQQLIGTLDSNTWHLASHPSICLNMNGIFLEMSTAITVGSIISEFASPLTSRTTGQSQTVHIDMERRNDRYRLSISAPLDETSLEMALISTYVSQLRGTIATGESNAAVAITFTSDPFKTTPPGTAANR